MVNEKRKQRVRTLLDQANRIRFVAYELQSSGLHELAAAKMREIERVVRELDAELGERKGSKLRTFIVFEVQS